MPAQPVESEAAPGPAESDLRRALNRAFERVADGGQALQLADEPEPAESAGHGGAADPGPNEGSASTAGPAGPLRRLVLPDTSPMAPGRVRAGTTEPPESAAQAAGHDDGAHAEAGPGTPDSPYDLPTEMRPTGSTVAAGQTERREARVRNLVVNSPATDAGGAQVLDQLRRHTRALAGCLGTHALQVGLGDGEPLVVQASVVGTVGGSAAAPVAHLTPTLETPVDRCLEGILRRALHFPDQPSTPLEIQFRLELE